MFSKACEYGIRATLFVATQSLQQKRVVLPDLAKAIDSPLAFTAKIMQQLSRSKIVRSVKGPNGGFYMRDEMTESCKLIDIVLAIDGDAIITECCLGLKKCDEAEPCPVHSSFKNIRAEIIEMLEQTSLKDIAEKIERGEAVLKISNPS
ncbi:MAG: Rrf2 family transcriptional regulator, partial [Flavobacteriaceae bacterium]|nr:Rrf2 family transcriptional regulator [Flavobacteriaceae bacterium]